MDITRMINDAHKAEFKTPSRRRKMCFRDFESIGACFNDFYRSKLGYVYVMESILTQEQKDYILHFKNTRVALASHKYVPEIKKSLVLIADKCFKAKEGVAK